MKLVFPIKLDAPAFRRVSGKRHKTTHILQHHLKEDAWFVDSSGRRITVSGYDASEIDNGRGFRITNLAKISRGELYKECPKCKRRKRLHEYGREGRNAGTRDQSNCNQCRKQYG